MTATIEIGEDPWALALSPDGSRAYVTNNSDDTVSVIDTSRAEVIATIDVDGYPSSVALSPDGTRAYVTNGIDRDTLDGSLSVIDTTRNEVTATIALGIYPMHIALSPDGAVPTSRIPSATANGTTETATYRSSTRHR